MAGFDVGTAELMPPSPLVAGSHATVELIYTAGHPIDDSGYVKIVFREVGDFGTPQFDDPKAPNYCSVRTTGDCRILPRWDPKGHTRPWGQALYLQVRFGYLDAGEKISVLFGDTREGSPGWQVQTFCERTFEFKVLVDPIATFRFKELVESPDLEVVAGPPARAVCMAPSQLRVGEEFFYRLRLEDEWGNPIRAPKATRHPGFERAGVERLSVRDEATDLAAVSNPIEVLDAPSALQLCWADFHGQSEETIGSNTIEDYCRFARDVSHLDICAHQGNDFQVTDDFWDTVNEAAAEFHEPGSFVTFPGYEWSGNTPLGGDRNVYFLREGCAIVRSCRDLLPGRQSRYPDGPTADDLFERLRDEECFVFAHAGGRYANLDMHGEGVEVAVEVHSAWGTFEWLVDDALRRGYHVGICANSDGHKCRPGASYPGARKFGSLGGLTCVLARELTRESVYEAMKARHFYATTGRRMILDVSVDPGDGSTAVMGDVVGRAGGTSVLSVRVAGTAPIQEMEVRNGVRPMHALYPGPRTAADGRIKITWSGAEVRGRNRMVRWDGELAVRANRILAHQPVGFWNPTLHPFVSENAASWTSVTTGGTAGLILRLEDPSGGRLVVRTAQTSVEVDVANIDRAGKTWALGGLGKKIRVCRLPDDAPLDYSVDLPIDGIGEGENPIYVRVLQEDGHMAWSSPIYVVA